MLASSPTQSPFIRLCRRLSPPSPGAVCFCSLMLITPDCEMKWRGSCCVRCRPAREGSSRERSRMKSRKEEGWHSCGPGHCCAWIPEGLWHTCSGSGLRNQCLTDSWRKRQSVCLRYNQRSVQTSPLFYVLGVLSTDMGLRQPRVWILALHLFVKWACFVFLFRHMGIMVVESVLRAALMHS